MNTDNFEELFFDFFREKKDYCILTTPMVQVTGRFEFIYWNEKITLQISWNEVCDFRISSSEILKYEIRKTCIGIEIDIHTDKGILIFR